MQPLLKTHLKRGPMAKQRNHGKAEDTEAEKTVEHLDFVAFCSDFVHM